MARPRTTPTDRLSYQRGFSKGQRSQKRRIERFEAVVEELTSAHDLAIFCLAEMCELDIQKALASFTLRKLRRSRALVRRAKKGMK